MRVVGSLPGAGRNPTPRYSFSGLPGAQAFLQLLGELRRVGRGLERQRRQAARQLVLPVPVGRRCR